MKAFATLDACTLMSPIIRPLLLRLATQGVFVPIWSEHIGLEWRRNAARIWDIDAEFLMAQWQAMRNAFPQADPGPSEIYTTGLRASDPKDWHVIATALAAKARCGLQRTPESIVVTWNLRDFNRPELRRLGLSLASPDDFLVRLANAHPVAMRQALLDVPADRLALARAIAEPLTDTLGRERLFKLRGLLPRLTGTGCDTPGETP